MTNDENFADRLAAFDDALQRGETPNVSDESNDPKFVGAVETIGLLNRLWSDTNAECNSTATHPAAPSDIDNTDPDIDLNFLQYTSPAADPTSFIESSRRIGRFELIRQLGQGGSGIVFLARDCQLHRYVALKVPRVQTLITPDLRRRFHLETRAAAALSHPNIVPVYDAGASGPICYIAAEYCSGPSLAEWLANGGRVSPQCAASWVAQLADAIEHAHSRGVLHRDLKPGNILLATQSSGMVSASAHESNVTEDQEQFTPRITDFGLAKFEASDDTATGTGTLLGTIAYMAPEQIEGDTASIDRRTDIYGLGAILYELICGRPAFVEPTYLATLLAIREPEPPSPRSLQPNVSRDLEAICLTSLEKNASKRYMTAAHLAADLRRYLNGEPTVVRPLGKFHRGVRWVQRHRLLAALAAVIIFSTIAFSIGTVWHLVRLRHELNVSDRLRQQAVKRETNYHELSYAADLRLANLAILNETVGRAAELLTVHIPLIGEQDYRDVEWYFLHHYAIGDFTVIDDADAPIHDIAISPDRTHLVSVGNDGNLTVYAWPAAKKLQSIPTGQLKGHGVAYAEDSNILATTGNEGSLRIWERFNIRHNARAHTGNALAVVYSKPTKTWITCGVDGRIRRWKNDNAEPSSELEINPTSVTALAAGSKFPLLASVGHDSHLHVWDLSTNKEVHTVDLEANGKCVAFSANDEVLAVGLVDGHIARWRVSDWTELPNISEVLSATCIKFSADNRVMAVGTAQGAVWVWRHVDSGPDRFERPKHIALWQAHTGRIRSIALDIERDELISAGDDGKLIRWPSYSDRLHERRFKIDGRYVRAKAFPDRPLVAAVSEERVVIVDVCNGNIAARLDQQGHDWTSVSVAVSANAVAAGTKTGDVWIWPDWHFSDHSQVIHLGSTIENLSLSHDGRRLAVQFHDKNVGPLFFDLASDTRQSELVGSGGCSSLALSPDGTLLAVGEHDTNTISIWMVPQHSLLHKVTCHKDSVYALAFSNDSSLLAAVDDSARVSIWNCQTNRRVWSALYPSGGRNRFTPSIAFTPKGRSILVEYAFGEMSFWHIPSGRETASLEHLQHNIESLSFADHGRYICGINSRDLCVIPTGVPEGGISNASAK